MFRKKFILLIFLVIFLFGNESYSSSDIYPERPKDIPYFYNETSIMEIKQDVCAELRRARMLTGIEFVVAILKKIPETISIEKYASGLFHKWKIGSKTQDKGVLILFVEDTHTLKIEVSYELEGIFTDAFCSSFQPTIKSYYAGRYFGDVFTGLIFCLEKKVIDGSELKLEDVLAQRKIRPKPIGYTDIFLSGGAGIIDDEYFYDKDTKLSLIRIIPEERIKEFDTDKDIEVVIKRYFKTLEEGINYPFLGIFVEGSQMMRLEYPKSVNFLQSQRHSYRKALPYQIIYSDNGDLAAVRFMGKQSSWALPIFLRRTPEGFWKIDVTKSWAFSQGTADLRGVYSLYKDHPWMFAFSKYKRQKSHCQIPDLIPFPLNLKEKIKALEEAIKNNPTDASNYFKLADIFYWECYWIRAAIDVVERGLELEPDNVSYRWLAIYMRYRFPSVGPIPKHYEALLEIMPNDIDFLCSYSRHCWHFSMDYKKAISLLKVVRKIEKHSIDSSSAYESYLKYYKKNYWQQVGLDRNIFWKVRNYIYIFYLP